MLVAFVVYVFTNLSIHVYTNDEVRCVSGCYESDEVSFCTNIGRAVADDCCVGVAIKSCYHHPRLYFLYAMIFNILAMSVPVFLYVYHVYVMIYRRFSQVR